MTAIALYTRLGRMLEEKMIKEDDAVFWSGIVNHTKINVPVTGLEAGSQDIPFHSVETKVGTLVFGKVVS